MEEKLVPIYLLSGFLESGKTTFLDFTLSADYFQIPGKTILLLCEEGEVEFNEKGLEKANVITIVVEKKDDLTPEFLDKINKEYVPHRIVVEYNGMWSVKDFEEMKKPYGWFIDQEITIVDASTFDLYMTNMKSIFMEMVKNANMIVFNRCKSTDPLPKYRRGIKVVNPSAEIVFEDEEGEIEDIFKNQEPFDMTKDLIDIPDEDYGIWFVDAMDNPMRYDNRKIRFKGRVIKPMGIESGMIIPGRTAMTCCADDTTFIGYLCYAKNSNEIKEGSWVDVTAIVKIEYRKEYQGQGVVLHGIDIEPCEPLKDEMVYFN